MSRPLRIAYAALLLIGLAALIGIDVYFRIGGWMTVTNAIVAIPVGLVISSLRDNP